MSKSKRDYYDIAMEEICLNCGEHFGRHSSFDCPGRKTHFFGHLDADLTLLAIQTPVAVIPCSDLGIMPGPRKPPPGLPVEVHNSTEFNAEAAWKAMRDLSKGS